jgi:hypothetical protein
MFRRLPVALIALAAPFGCGSTESAEPAPRRMSEAQLQEFRQAWSTGAERQHVRKVQETAVATGRPPLAFITTYECSAWVVSSAGRQWGPLRVPTNTLIRVAPKSGVAIGTSEFPGDPGTATYTIHISAPQP